MVRFGLFAASVLLLFSVLGSAAFVCNTIYSSDDCSGNPKYPTSCNHDGQCFPSNVPISWTCNPDGNSYTTFFYAADDVDCNATATQMDSTDNGPCYHSGTDTLKFSCESSLPEGAILSGRTAC